MGRSKRQVSQRDMNRNPRRVKAIVRSKQSYCGRFQKYAEGKTPDTRFKDITIVNEMLHAGAINLKDYRQVVAGDEKLCRDFISTIPENSVYKEQLEETMQSDSDLVASYKKAYGSEDIKLSLEQWITAIVAFAEMK